MTVLPLEKVIEKTDVRKKTFELKTKLLKRG
jgi:hypothetical protein